MRRRVGFPQRPPFLFPLIVIMSQIKGRRHAGRPRTPRADVAVIYEQKAIVLPHSATIATLVLRVFPPQPTLPCRRSRCRSVKRAFVSRKMARRTPIVVVLNALLVPPPQLSRLCLGAVVRVASAASRKTNPKLTRRGQADPAEATPWVRLVSHASSGSGRR